MARITTYPNDEQLQNGDKLLGTDVDSGNTENYTLEELRSFLTQGLGGSLPVEVPLGFAATVKRDGSDIERSLYRILEKGPEVTITQTDLNGGSVFLNGRNAATFAQQSASSNILTIRDLNDGMLSLAYDLESFAGSTAEIRVGTTTYSGTINAFLPPEFLGSDADDTFTNSTYSTVNGNIYTDWRFTFTTNADSPSFASLANQQVDAITINNVQPIVSQFIGGVEITGDLLVEGDLTVEGTSFFQDIEVAGTATFTGNSGGINFGRPTGISITHDGTNISIGGSGNITTNRPNNYPTAGHLTINNEDVRIVRGDSRAPNLRGLLTSLRIGDEYWVVPAADSGVLQALPGVNQELQGVPEATTTNIFFYAREVGNQVEGATAIATNPQGIAISAGLNSTTVQMDQRAAVQTAFEGIPQGQRLFFTIGDDEIPTDQVPAPVYEVVEYDSTDGSLLFGQLGGGALIIATNNVRFPSVIDNDLPDNTRLNVALLNGEDGTLYAGGEASRVPTFRGLTYEDSQMPATMGSVNSISIQPSSAYTINGAGDIELNIAGAPRFSDTVGPASDSFTAVAGNSYILLPITEVETATLPAGTSGDIISFSNISRNSATSLMFDGMSANWRIIPSAGQRISMLPPDEELILDNARVQFQLIYTNEANGWIIV